MDKKRIIKDIITLVVLEAIILGVLFFFSSIALGGGKYSPNVVFDVSQSMITGNTKYIGVYAHGNTKTEYDVPEIPGYYCICKTDAEQLIKESKDDTVRFEFTPEQTEALRKNKDDTIFIVFMNKEGGITLKSQTISLK